MLKKVGNLKFNLSILDRRFRTTPCHTNSLKVYEGWEIAVCCAVPEFVKEEELSHRGNPEVSSLHEELVSGRFYNTQVQAVFRENLQHLKETQKEDVVDLDDNNPMLCRDVPGRTNLAVHDVDDGDAIHRKQHPYRYLPHKKSIVQEEVVHILQIEVTE